MASRWMQEGIDPKALERACRRHKAKVVYLMPTMHNPTTATMTPQRRARVAQIIRKHALTLIEDDPYAFLTSGITPLTALIPERSYLAASLSKCIAPGLRASLLVVPDSAAAARLTSTLRATVQMSVPLIVAIVTRWMRDGSADDIIEADQHGSRGSSEACARRPCRSRLFRASERSPHLAAAARWLVKFALCGSLAETRPRGRNRRSLCDDGRAAELHTNCSRCCPQPAAAPEGVGDTARGADVSGLRRASCLTRCCTWPVPSTLCNALSSPPNPTRSRALGAL